MSIRNKISVWIVDNTVTSFSRILIKIFRIISEICFWIAYNVFSKSDTFFSNKTEDIMLFIGSYLGIRMTYNLELITLYSVRLISFFMLSKHLPTINEIFPKRNSAIKKACVNIVTTLKETREETCNFGFNKLINGLEKEIKNL